MYFRFSCPHCGKSLKVRQEHAGRRLGCPYCKGAVAVPTAEPPPLPPEAPASPAESPPPEGLDELRQLKTTESRPAVRHRPPAKKPVAAPAAAATKWSDGTNVGAVASGVCGLLICVVLLAATYPLQGFYLGELFWRRGWVPFVLVFLMSWSIAILVMKWRRLSGQRASMLFDLLPNELSEEITIRSIDDFRRHIAELPVEPGGSFLINRVRRGLEHFAVRKSAPEVANVLGSQSEIDATAVDSSYTLLKVFIWAIPILGFIGTVIGISAAVGGFSGSLEQASDVAVLKQSLNKVTEGLATAFDTTLVALVMSLLVMFPTASLQKAEEDLLNWVDEYCNENFLKRLNDGREGGAERGVGGGDAAATQRAIDRAMQPHHDELAAWREKLHAVGEQLTGQLRDAWSGLNEERLQQIDAMDNALDEFQDTLLSLAEQTVAMQQRSAASLAQSAESMQQYFHDLGRGLGALNDVLTRLGEQQIVYQTQPRRRWKIPFVGRDDGGQ